MRYVLFSNDNMKIPKIDSIGFATSPKVTRFGPGQRNLYIIHFVTQGKGYYNGNVVKKGQGFLIKPYSIEEYYPDENEPWGFFWIISSDFAMEDIFKYFDADVNSQIFNYDFRNVIESLSEQVVAKNNPILHSSELLEMFLHILNYHLSKFTRKEDYFEFAVKYINANIQNSISVKQLIDILGISQPYLFKIFKTRINKSPKQYIDGVKLRNAKSLLRETDLSISEISEILGYIDQSSFSKFFSEKAKMSPSKYRKDKTL